MWRRGWDAFRTLVLVPPPEVRAVLERVRLISCWTCMLQGYATGRFNVQQTFWAMGRSSLHSWSALAGLRDPSKFRATKPVESCQNEGNPENLLEPLAHQNSLLEPISPDRWHSPGGIANRAWGVKLHREFESLPLRQIHFQSDSLVWTSLPQARARN